MDNTINITTLLVPLEYGRHYHPLSRALALYHEQLATVIINCFAAKSLHRNRYSLVNLIVVSVRLVLHGALGDVRTHANEKLGCQHLFYGVRGGKRC